MTYVPPSQGFGDEAIDDELEGGFNEAFEEGFTVASRIGRIAMVALTLAALVGAFGHGPLSHASAQSKAHLMSADFEPVARDEAPTAITLHLKNLPPGDYVLTLNNAFIEPMGLQTVLPRPRDYAASGSNVAFTVTVRPARNDALVRLNLLPATVGLVSLQVRLSGPGSLQDQLAWTQMVMP